MEKGIILTITGDGKGKTTSAVGTALRSLGWGKKVCMIQFYKSEAYESGEREMLRTLGAEVYTLGAGFSWTKDESEHIKMLKKAWQKAEEKLKEPSCDLLILDEINIVLSQTAIDFSSVLTKESFIEALRQRPAGQDVILTGRKALPEIIALSDTVSEIKNIKHCFEKGVAAKRVMEY